MTIATKDAGSFQPGGPSGTPHVAAGALFSEPMD